MSRPFKFGERPFKIGVILTEQARIRLDELVTYAKTDRSSVLNDLIMSAAIEVKSNVQVQPKEPDPSGYSEEFLLKHPELRGRPIRGYPLSACRTGFYQHGKKISRDINDTS